MNTLYDLPGTPLRKRGELLRLRKYGNEWLLTHKGKGKVGRHKTRVENETKLEDGTKADLILRSLDFRPTFRYEKFRAQWTDGQGHVVVDETPIGNLAEIEGPHHWIDRTASLLGVRREDYITDNYVTLFLRWKARNHSPAKEMTFAALRKRR